MKKLFLILGLTPMLALCSDMDKPPYFFDKNDSYGDSEKWQKLGDYQYESYKSFEDWIRIYRPKIIDSFNDLTKDIFTSSSSMSSSSSSSI